MNTEDTNEAQDLLDEIDRGIRPLSSAGLTGWERVGKSIISYIEIDGNEYSGTMFKQAGGVSIRIETMEKAYRDKYPALERRGK